MWWRKKQKKVSSETHRRGGGVTTAALSGTCRVSPSGFPGKCSCNVGRSHLSWWVRFHVVWETWWRWKSADVLHVQTDSERISWQLQMFSSYSSDWDAFWCFRWWNTIFSSPGVFFVSADVSPNEQRKQSELHPNTTYNTDSQHDGASNQPVHHNEPWTGTQLDESWLWILWCHSDNCGNSHMYSEIYEICNMEVWLVCRGVTVCRWMWSVLKPTGPFYVEQFWRLSPLSDGETFIRDRSPDPVASDIRDEHMQSVCVSSRPPAPVWWSTADIMTISWSQRRLLDVEHNSSHQDVKLAVLLRHILTSHVLITCSIPDFTSGSNTRWISGGSQVRRSWRMLDVLVPLLSTEAATINRTWSLSGSYVQLATV